MNRNQRKFYRSSPKRNNVEEKLKESVPNHVDIEEVLPPKSYRHPFKTDKPMTNRCCSVSPDCKDVEQATEYSGLDDQFQNLVIQQYDFDPAIPDTIKQLKELQKAIYEVVSKDPKVENSTQYVNPVIQGSSYIETADGFQWHNIDNTDDVEEYLTAEKDNDYTVRVTPDKNIYISDVPEIKVIVERFTKFKKNDVELRKLEEKIVCIEYDVFEETNDIGKNKSEPIQKMRVYFSIKPTHEKEQEHPSSDLSSTVKRNFNINDEDLNRLNEKEIEIIDSKLAINKPYLNDLKRVLKRKQEVHMRKKKSSLDLMALYGMAKNETVLENFSDINIISEAELEKVKDLVTKQCVTSKHGINRRSVKSEKTSETKNGQFNIFSESIIELIKNVNYGL